MLVLTLATDRVIPLFDLGERDGVTGQALSEDKQDEEV